ncbi:Uncharacterised protein [Enterobacter cloacae]|uniref:Uncharacterized protein n=1 Tax=Enterobacter cloacae TaxID=550 RepID=A0A156W3U4_ENTCL|nr:Uncharacterised protein [Enterobacter cloacae]SAG07793.1 Uncharacterised protein [Enterobacter cloacae]
MRVQLRLNVRAAAERGHRQVKERGQRAQNRLQRDKFTKRHQMVLVIPVSGVVAVLAVFPERNDAVVGVVAVLLIQTRIDNPGDQRAAARQQQVVHHVEERLLVNFQIGDCRLRPDNQLRFTHHLFGGVGVDLQRIQQLFLIPLHGLRDIPLHHGNLHGAIGLRREPLDIAQREGQGEQHQRHGQRFPAALDQRQDQQSAHYHQQEVDGFNTHYRRQAFQRAVNLAVAELQPREARQHPAAQELGELPDHRRGNGDAQPGGFWPQARKDAGEQTGIK